MIRTLGGEFLIDSDILSVNLRSISAVSIPPAAPAILMSVGKLNTRKGNVRTAAEATTPPTTIPRNARRFKALISLRKHALVLRVAWFLVRNHCSRTPFHRDRLASFRLLEHWGLLVFR
jgi:hypothetical protein